MNAAEGIFPAQYSVNEFIASSTPFFTPSSNSKSPTTSFAANGLTSSSPPVFSLIDAAHVLKVCSPTPAGHDVWIFHVVVSAAAALRMKSAPTMAAVPAAAAPAVFSSLRRVGSGVTGACVAFFVSSMGFLQVGLNYQGAGLRAAG